jgi:hypothetical protein
MKKPTGRYTISDRQGEIMVNAMRRRGEELYAKMTRRTQPRPEDVRTTHNTITRINKDQK